MRIKNSVRNITNGVIGLILTYIFTFAVRTLFIKKLGVEYLGLNGLFTNVISILSVAELGVGLTITFSLYKPLAEKNEKKTKALMDIFGKVYVFISLVVLAIGILLLPFLPYLMKEQTNIQNVYLIYLLFLLNSVLSYFFSYRYSIIGADQKGYIVIKSNIIFSFILSLLQILVLFLWQSFIIYLIINILINLIQNIYLSKKAIKLYPYLKMKGNYKIDKADADDLFKKIRAMMFQKIGSVSLYATDNIIISTFIGVYWVGIYSNYVMIIVVVTNLVGQIYSQLTSSVGNLVELESKEKSYEIFLNLLFFTFWLAGFCSICLLGLINNFIYLWIGKQYLLDFAITFVIVLNFMLLQHRNVSTIFTNSMGLFWHTRYVMFITAILNLLISIILINRVGLIGTLIGTAIAHIVTNFWFEPFVVLKYGFNKRLSNYFKRYSIYTLILFAVGTFTIFLCSFVKENSIVTLIIRLLICIIIPNVLFYIIYRHTKEFNYFKDIAKNIINKRIE